MKYKLSKLTMIPKRERLILEEAGIEDTDQLLSCAGKHHEREALGERLGINQDNLMKWASVSDLVRVKGVGVQIAEILIETNIARNVQELSALDIGEILAKLIPLGRGEKNRKHTLSKTTLLEIVSEASELRPRMLVSKQDYSKEFRAKIFEKGRQDIKANLAVLMLPLVICMVAAMGIWLKTAYLLGMLRDTLSANNEIEGKIIEFYETLYRFQDISWLSAIGVFALLLLLFEVIFLVLGYLANTWLIQWIFNKPVHQKFYDSIRLSHEFQRKLAWRQVFLLTGIGIIILLIGFFMFTSGVDLQKILRFIVSLGAVLMGVDMIRRFMPVLKQYSRYQNTSQLAIQGFQRFMLLNLIAMVISTLALVLFIQTGFTLFSKVSNNLIVQELYVQAQQTLSEQLDEIVSLNSTSGEESVIAQIMISTMSNEMDTLKDQFVFVAVDPFTQELLVSLVTNMAVWLLLVSYLMLFVLPYLILGNWVRGVYYIVLLGLSFQSENLISAYAPYLFNQPAHSLESGILIAFFIFANALLFDWLYDNYANTLIECENCQHLNDGDSLYCSKCGFLQEKQSERKKRSRFKSKLYTNFRDASA